MNNKKSKIKKALPLISVNAIHLPQYKNINKNEIKNLIHKLATTIDIDMWINLSNTKLDIEHIMNKYDNKNIQDERGEFKPNGLYLSKGDWLFHEAAKTAQTDNENDRYLNLIKVNYTNIKIITSLDELTKFTDIYQVIEEKYTIINWRKVADKYDGICVVPDLGSSIKKLYGLSTIPKKYYWALMLDVSTLILWNSRVIKSCLNYSLVKAGEPINNRKFFLETMVERILEKLI